MVNSRVGGVHFNGLLHFIDDLYEAQRTDPNLVHQRIESELAKVRKAFLKRKLSLYDKQKYVLKLTIINMLGYDCGKISFPIVSADLLNTSNTLLSIRIGLMACSSFYADNQPLAGTLSEILLRHLSSASATVSCLALNAAGVLMTHATAHNFYSPMVKLAKGEIISNCVLGSNPSDRNYNQVCVDAAFENSTSLRALLLLNRLLLLDPGCINPEEIETLCLSSIQKRIFAALKLSHTLITKLEKEELSENFHLNLFQHVLEFLESCFRSKSFSYHGVVAPILFAHCFALFRDLSSTIQQCNEDSVNKRFVERLLTLCRHVSSVEYLDSASGRAGRAAVYSAQVEVCQLLVTLSFIPSDVVLICVSTLVSMVAPDRTNSLKSMALSKLIVIIDWIVLNSTDDVIEFLSDTVSDLCRFCLVLLYDNDSYLQRLVSQCLVSAARMVPIDLCRKILVEILTASPILPSSCRDLIMFNTLRALEFVSPNIYFVECVLAALSLELSNDVFDDVDYDLFQVSNYLVRFIVANEHVQPAALSLIFSSLSSNIARFVVPFPFLYTCVFLLGEFCHLVPSLLDLVKLLVFCLPLRLFPSKASSQSLSFYPQIFPLVISALTKCAVYDLTINTNPSRVIDKTFDLEVVLSHDLGGLIDEFLAPHELETKEMISFDVDVGADLDDITETLPKVLPVVVAILERLSLLVGTGNIHADVEARIAESLTLLSLDAAACDSVFQVLPPFPISLSSQSNWFFRGRTCCSSPKCDDDLEEEETKEVAKVPIPSSPESVVSAHFSPLDAVRASKPRVFVPTVSLVEQLSAHSSEEETGTFMSDSTEISTEIFEVKDIDYDETSHASTFSPVVVDESSNQEFDRFQHKSGGSPFVSLVDMLSDEQSVSEVVSSSESPVPLHQRSISFNSNVLDLVAAMDDDSFSQ
ncbi:hypothetical protein RCL1_006216 [Eukaryota sp. TZLM3-RCL]